MSGMEPEVKNFLSKIITSISVTLLWLLINCSMGIGFNFAFFDRRPTAGNYIFYAWFIISLILLIIFYKKKWEL